MQNSTPKYQIGVRATDGHIDAKTFLGGDFKRDWCGWLERRGYEIDGEGGYGFLPAEKAIELGFWLSPKLGRKLLEVHLSWRDAQPKPARKAFDRPYTHNEAVRYLAKRTLTILKTKKFINRKMIAGNYKAAYRADQDTIDDIDVILDILMCGLTQYQVVEKSSRGRCVVIPEINYDQVMGKILDTLFGITDPQALYRTTSLSEVIRYLRMALDKQKERGGSISRSDIDRNLVAAIRADGGYVRDIYHNVNFLMQQLINENLVRQKNNDAWFILGDHEIIEKKLDNLTINYAD